MPRNTKTVISIVPVAWSQIEANVYPSPPQKLSAKTSALNATTAITINTKMGTTLAMVTM